MKLALQTFVNSKVGGYRANIGLPVQHRANIYCVIVDDRYRQTFTEVTHCRRCFTKVSVIYRYRAKFRRSFFDFTVNQQFFTEVTRYRQQLPSYY